MKDSTLVIQTRRLRDGLETSAADIKRALTRGSELARTTPHAASVRYASTKKLMELIYPDGTTLGLPVAQFDEFARLTEKQRATVKLAYNGTALRVEDADLVVSIAGMVSQLDIARTFQRIAASLAGRVTNTAKAAAARANGLAGGRPRKSAAQQKDRMAKAAYAAAGAPPAAGKAVGLRTNAKKTTSKASTKPRSKKMPLKGMAAKKAARKTVAKRKSSRTKA